MHPRTPLPAALLSRDNGRVFDRHGGQELATFWPSAGHAKISAGLSQRGDFTMARKIDWEHMTDKQKFDFLYCWCHKLEALLEGRRKVIYRINAELQKVHKKLEREI